MLDFFAKDRDKPYDDYLFDFYAQRRDMDAAIDEALKQKALARAVGHADAPSDDLPEELESVIEQAEQLLAIGGIWLEERGGAAAKQAAVSRLSPEAWRRIPTRKRVEMACQMLQTLDALEAAEIYPGPLPVTSLFIGGDTSDVLLLGDVIHFQLGCLKYTWPLHDNSDDFEVAYRYPFFDRTLQRTANARLILRLFEDCPCAAVLQRTLSDKKAYAPQELASVIRDIVQPPSAPISAPVHADGTVGICVLAAPCSAAAAAEQYVRQIALINNAVAAAMRGSSRAVSAAYAWCGRDCDVSGGIGKANVRAFRRFDRGYIPNIQYPSLADPSQLGSDGNFKHAYIAAESMLRLSGCSQKLLFILLPDSSQSGSWVINRANELKDTGTAVFYLCENNRQMWRSGINTKDEKALRQLFNDIARLINPNAAVIFQK